MTDDVLLAAQGLTRSYGRHNALNGVDITLRRGEILGFLGLNGAGKSTTMQILSGAVSADSGTVTVCGYDIIHRARKARAHLGYLPQQLPLYDDLTVNESLHLHSALHLMATAAATQAIERARARLNLNDHGARLVRHLSGGYRQRLGLAQALVHDPDVLILDEPTTGLDPAQRRDVHALLREFSDERAVMVSTHILAEVQALATHVMILHHGRVVHDVAVGANSGIVKARFDTQPQADMLVDIAGIDAAEFHSNGYWLIRADPSCAAAVARAAVQADWGLLELVPNYDALEQSFLNLTTGTEPKP